MKSDSNNSLQFSISPDTVYLSTGSGQTSYANLTITAINQDIESVAVTRIAITLPTSLVPAISLGSISAVPPAAWNFSASQITPGEFDATPAAGNYVMLNAAEPCNFTLNMITLVSATSQSDASVSVVVSFAEGDPVTIGLSVIIAKASSAITEFTSIPASIPPNCTAQLSWSCTSIDYCMLTPSANINHLPSNGTLTVSPSETTTYTLYAFTPKITLSLQWTITIETPQVITFEADNQQTIVDCGGSITLNWACNQYTDNITMTNNGINVPGLLTKPNTPLLGSITINNITAPSNFTLFAYRDKTQDPDDKIAFISITDVSGSLIATPDSGIWAEDSVTLSWDITSASAVSLVPEVANGPSLQKLAGSVTVNPLIDTTYTLNVSGYNNNQSQNNQYPVTLNVTPVIINSFTVSPVTIIPLNGANTCNLEWDTQSQTVLLVNIGNEENAGNYPLTAPADGSKYSLSAGTTQNPNQQTAEVTIANAFGPFFFTAFTPDTIDVGYTDLKVPVPGSMQALTDYLGGYTATITGVTATNAPPGATFLVSAIYLWANSYFMVTFQPYNGTAPAFEWTNPDDQTGTITITGLAGGQSKEQ